MFSSQGTLPLSRPWPLSCILTIWLHFWWGCITSVGLRNVMQTARDRHVNSRYCVIPCILHTQILFDLYTNINLSIVCLRWINWVKWEDYWNGSSFESYFCNVANHRNFNTILIHIPHYLPIALISIWKKPADTEASSLRNNYMLPGFHCIKTLVALTDFRSVRERSTVKNKKKNRRVETGYLRAEGHLPAPLAYSKVFATFFEKSVNCCTLWTYFHLRLM